MKYVLVKAGFSTGEIFDSVEELIKAPKYSPKTDSIYELGQQVEVKVETKVTYKNPVTRSLTPEDYEDVGNYRG